MLLPSGSDMVHGHRLHRTRNSTLLTRTCFTDADRGTGLPPCCSGLQVQGTANSPSSAANCIQVTAFHCTLFSRPMQGYSFQAANCPIGGAPNTRLLVIRQLFYVWQVFAFSLFRSQNSCLRVEASMTCHVFPQQQLRFLLLPF